MLKITSKLLASIIIINQIFNINTLAYANTDYDYSNPIYENGIDDKFVYDSTDSVIVTKTDIPRKLPKVTGAYDKSQYPIPLVNKVPDKNAFELIKAENKELMNRVEEDIKNGTLTKHIAADGQFYGSVPDDALGVEKKIYVNTNIKGSHSLASYVPAGEIATIKLNGEALEYAKKGKVKISVGMTMVDAVEFDHNKNDENRMPYLGKTFSITESETKVGTPFGGMVYIDIDDSVPSGLKFEVDVSGVVDTPYYDLGRTTYEEWQKSKNSPGLFAEIRTPYLRFLIPAKFIREIDNPHDAALFWTNVASISSDVMAQQYRTKPMTLTFDQYITVGIAYASVGSWTCNLPPSWGTNAMDYNMLVTSGGWGIIHEINHHYQGRHGGYGDDWGVGPEFSEITNNALSAISYILYTNIAEYRNESGTEDWNKVADPYSSLKQQIYEGDHYYTTEPNRGNFMYSTFAHEIGPINFANVIKSTYDGGTFNGIYIPPYDYRGESQGKLSRNDRYDDFAYRLCIAAGRDYTWYIQNELAWPLRTETVNAIKKHGYKEIIPVQSVYGIGEVGRETGRPFYIPSSGYVFDFQKSLVSPGNATVVDVSKPKYGTLTKLSDGKYDYKPSKTMPENAKEEFILTVRVEAGGISHETKLNCTIGIDYNSSNVEKFAITKWDIRDALKDLETAKPYGTSYSIGMRINNDYGNNTARSKGYFVLEEGGEYQFQVYGDDNAAFELHLDDGTTLQSITEEYSKNVDDAFKHQKSISFTTTLEANKAYAYTLVANNKDGIGWADVSIRKTSGDTSWKSINQVYANLSDVGKKTDRTFTMPEPEYIRPPVLASGNETIVRNMKVISHPKGVDPNNPASAHEADPNNMLDGDINTYFHSSYNSDKTPFPHEYIFDLSGEKSFNNLEIYTRRVGEEAGIIGDYEIYIADEYDGSNNTIWKKVAEDHTRKNNQNAPKDLKITLPQTKAKYLKIKALNNRGNYDLTIIAEVKLSTTTNVKNVIPQNSSFIQYKDEWRKDLNGAFVNGATYNSTDGYFMYCFEGKESNIYVTKDVEVEMRVNGGKWHKVKLIGSLREPSITLNMGAVGKNVVEVRGIGQEIALNMISTDGNFYKGKAPAKSNPPIIEGATNIEIGIGEVDTFDKKNGVTVIDDNDSLTVDDIKITGTIEKPAPGENKVSKITYSVKDSDRNVTTVIREITVTNQLPIISGLTDVTIKKGTKFDLKDKIVATDYEDKDITQKIIYPTEDVSTLNLGTHKVKYKVEDSDKNVTEAERTIVIIPNNAPIITGVDNVEIGVGKVDTFDIKAGVRVNDDYDKLTIDDITVTGKIEKPVPGENKVSELTYSVKDSDGNITTVKRNITVTNQLPIISGLDEVVIRKGDKFDLTSKVVATDYEDKNITNKIVYPTQDVSILDVGTYIVNYSVEDSDKNITESKRTIKVISNNSPIITGVNNIEIGIGKVDTFDTKAGITVSDDRDILTLNDVKISGTIEKPAHGENKVSELIYSVTDSDGNVTTVKREITVTNQLPVISGLDEVVIKKGDKFDLTSKVVATDYEDKDITNEITYPTEDVSTLDFGRHKVKYSVTDSDGNITEVERVINVLPSNSISIIGADNITIKVGEVNKFDKMAGVSYIDNNGITGLVINVTGDIGKPTPGTNEDYNLTYSVTDSNGNTTVTNRVITVTNQKPEIKGLTDIIIKEGEGKGFDFAEGISVTDLEDGNLIDSIQLPIIDLSKLVVGTYAVRYSVTDSDENITIASRKINVLTNKVDNDVDVPEKEDNVEVPEKGDNGAIPNENSNSNIIDKKDNSLSYTADKVIEEKDNDNLLNKEDNNSSDIDIDILDEDDILENNNDYIEEMYFTQTNNKSIITYIIIISIGLLTLIIGKKKYQKNK